MRKLMAILLLRSVSCLHTIKVFLNCNFTKFGFDRDQKQRHFVKTQKQNKKKDSDTTYPSDTRQGVRRSISSRK